MNVKLCQKGGHHQGRRIQAICLQQSCSSDRLICFYCKHQMHRNHETSYFPKGLTSSIQTLNENSRRQNSQKDKVKMDKKFISIKKGWQTIEQTMNNYLKQIQEQADLRLQTVKCTFSQNSVSQIKQTLSTKKLQPQQVQKWISMINTVNKYQLNNSNKIIAYSKFKQRVLKDVFKNASLQIYKLMNQLQQQSKNLDFTSIDLDKYIMENIQNQGNSNFHIFQNQDSTQLKKCFSADYTDSSFQQDQQYDYDEYQSLSYRPIKKLNLIQPFVSNQIQIQEQKNDQVITSVKPSDFLGIIKAKKFKIKINPEARNQNAQDFQIAQASNENNINQHSQNQRDLSINEPSQERNQQIQIQSEYDQQNQKQFFQQINGRKKTKLDKTLNHKDQQIDQQDQRRKHFSQKMQKIFDNSSEDQQKINKQEDFQQESQQIQENIKQDQQEHIQKNTQKNAKKTKYKKIGYNKSVSKEAVDKVISVPLGLGTPQPSEQFTQIQNRTFRLPARYSVASSQPKNAQTKFSKKQLLIQQNKQILVTNIKIFGQNQNDVKENLDLVDKKVIKKLEVYCDTNTRCVDFQCIEIISKMTNLTSLSLYLTAGLQKADVLILINQLPNLQELVLCQFNDMSVQIAQALRDKLPKLKRFYYTIDHKKYMQKMQQNFQFFVDIPLQQTSMQILEILTDIGCLQSIQLVNLPIKMISKVPSLLQKMHELKQISITFTQEGGIDCSSIIRYLAKTQSNLSVLCLQNVTFKQKNLVQIFKHNKNLNTLIVNQCLQLDNTTMQVLVDNCKALEQFSLMLTDTIHGRQIYRFSNLKTLILRGCWRIDQKFFYQNIHHLKNLECLSVSMNNFWFYDNLMKEVVKLNKLKILNIDTTKITDMGIKDIHKLNHLQTLICGKTQITFDGLIKSLQNPNTGAKNLTIRKLGLAKDKSYSKEVKSKKKKEKHDILIKEFHAKHLIELGTCVPQLSHLSIEGFTQCQKKYFKTLQKLKCLSLQKDQINQKTQKSLETKGVYLNLQL